MKLRRQQPKGAEGDAAQMALMDHLRELRNRVIKSVIAVAIGAVVAYLFYNQIFTFMTKPYCRAVAGTHKDCQLYFTDLLAGFLLRIKVASYGGTILALPVILWQLWRFITPGLYRNERRYALGFVVASVFLFSLGAALAYYTLPPMISWLTDNSGPSGLVQNLTTADKYFWLAALLMVGFGIGFEFPVLLVALQMVGVLDNAVLRKYRRHAFVGIVTLVAVITPGGDPISLMALSIPMYLFYEISIVIGIVVKRRRTRRESEPQPTAA